MHDSALRTAHSSDWGKYRIEYAVKIGYRSLVDARQLQISFDAILPIP